MWAINTLWTIRSFGFCVSLSVFVFFSLSLSRYHTYSLSHISLIHTDHEILNLAKQTQICSAYPWKAHKEIFHKRFLPQLKNSVSEIYHCSCQVDLCDFDFQLWKQSDCKWKLYYASSVTFSRAIYLVFFSMAVKTFFSTVKRFYKQTSNRYYATHTAGLWQWRFFVNRNQDGVLL